MIEDNFVVPAAVLGASRSVGQHPYISVAPRIRRRCLVGFSLAAADLLAGLIAVQMTAGLTGARFSVGSAAIPVLCAIYWVLGLYEGFGPCPYERVRLRVQGISLLAIAAFAGRAAVAPPLRPGSLVLACLLLVLIGYYMEVFTRTALIRHRLWGGATVFVGCGADRIRLARFLQEHPAFGLCPIGFVRTDQESADPMPASLPVLGGIADLAALAPVVEVLVFASAADTALVSPAPSRNLAAKHLVMVGESQDVPSLWLRTRTLGGLIGVELWRGSGGKWNRRIKRLVDLLVSVPACLSTAPIVALAAIAIKMADPGPAFYFQDRVGLDGRIIRVCKLRTMYRDAERRLEEHLRSHPQAQVEWQRFFKLTQDPRILPIVGTFLRRTSLDELPQLWSIVRGAMSLVGPRPFPRYHVDSFDQKFQSIRSSVPPGLSGLWQVSARSNGDVDVQRTEDLFYILNWSIWLDLYILIETPVAVIAARGAR
jgi:lipopolysaccharide/colanic/teichoic acid biosynthesis glycosyltransferase